LTVDNPSGKIKIMKKPVNLTNLSKKYGPGFVARVKGTTRVIGYAKRPNSLLLKIKNKKEFKENKVTISWIPKYGARYVFRIPFCLR